MSSAPPPPPDEPKPTTDAPAEPSAPEPIAPDQPSAGAAAPPPPAAAPPPPPPGPSFDAAGQARALFSQLDPSGVRPTVIVAGVILALFFGSQLLNAIIPVSAAGPGGPRPGGGPGPGPTIGPGPGPTTGPGGPGPITTPLPPGSSLTIGPLRMPLENGWVPQEVPNSNVIVRLSKGAVAIDVLSATLQGQADAADVYSAFMNSIAQSANGFGATQPSSVQIGAGIPAARGSYSGVFGETQVQGEATTFVAGGTGWIFDVWTGSGNLGNALPEAHLMINNIQAQ